MQGEHQIGFDLKTDIGKVVMPLGMDSLLARAVSSGQIERLTADERKNNKTPFSGSPGCALAIPIVAAGETLAIVYADDAGTSKHDNPEVDQARERIAEAMQQHVIALLLRMTNELKVRAELQAYARSLIHELQQMYAADEQAGKGGDDLGTRLKGNLDYARSIFESRVALEGGDAAALLDDELAALIESEQATPFGRDLAAAAGRPNWSPASAARRKPASVTAPRFLSSRARASAQDERLRVHGLITFRQRKRPQIVAVDRQQRQRPLVRGERGYGALPDPGFVRDDIALRRRRFCATPAAGPPHPGRSSPARSTGWPPSRSTNRSRGSNV